MLSVSEKMICYHCGDDCTDETILTEGKVFCCAGCKLVYEILQENNLCSYYGFNENPGVKIKTGISTRYSYLDEESVQQKLIEFRNRNENHITFYIPDIHCSSCIWLLENFDRVDNGVLYSHVNFLKKEVNIAYDNTKTSLRKIVESMASVGYEPAIHLDSIHRKDKKKTNYSRILRIGIAGFCFGNIMMLSFPEYFSSGRIADEGLKHFFSYMILLLSLPVFFYSASEFYIRSYRSLMQKTTSIDVPIALGIAAIFLRSSYEILSGTGAGFFDSGSGLIFFMLIGRWFQDFTFDALSFERDYKSYFPVAVNAIMHREEKAIPVDELKVNDKILIRNNEIIPVDATLLNGDARIDYSFVSGESMPVHVIRGEQIFAGGKQTGSIIELMVTKEISASHLARLWNNNALQDKENKFERLVKIISRYFIVVTLFIACTGAAYWWNTDMKKAMNAFTAVLVIACPCALALSAPFTYGNIMRILGKRKIYLKNYRVLENLADTGSVIFDKTGTLTENNNSEIRYEGIKLTADEEKIIYSLVRNSSHPLSKQLSGYLKKKDWFTVSEFEEFAGKGISGIVSGKKIRAGNTQFITGLENAEKNNLTAIHISMDGEHRCSFLFGNYYRKGINNIVQSLVRKYNLSVLSGDSDAERSKLETIFSGKANLLFNQTPADKQNYVESLQGNYQKVLMVGDGLNDAGALLQSDVGISITDNTNNFTPASDIIMDAIQLKNLENLIIYSQAATRIIIISFIISLLYNFIGLSFAVSGSLSPLIAAALMPISTISLVLYTVIASTIKGRMLGFR